jgi:hypothetical protein
MRHAAVPIRRPGSEFSLQHLRDQAPRRCGVERDPALQGASVFGSQAKDGTQVPSYSRAARLSLLSRSYLSLICGEHSSLPTGGNVVEVNGYLAPAGKLCVLVRIVHLPGAPVKKPLGQNREMRQNPGNGGLRRDPHHSSGGYARCREGSEERQPDPFLTVDLAKIVSI